MTREERLIEAIRRYPIGIRHKPVDLRTGEEYDGNYHLTSRTPQYGINEGCNSIYAGTGWIYSDRTDKWAAIEGEVNEYSIF